MASSGSTPDGPLLKDGRGAAKRQAPTRSPFAAADPLSDLHVARHAPEKLSAVELAGHKEAPPTKHVESQVDPHTFGTFNEQTRRLTGIPDKGAELIYGAAIEIESLFRDGSRIRFGAPQAETTPGIFSERTLEFRDIVSNVRGNHGLKFGGEYRPELNDDNLNGGSRPLYTFAGLFNFANDAPLFYQINADPETGGVANAQRHFRSSSYGVFFQDDWKARPNLTLNMGLRYEYFGVLKEKRRSDREFRVWSKWRFGWFES